MAASTVADRGAKNIAPAESLVIGCKKIISCADFDIMKISTECQCLNDRTGLLCRCSKLANLSWAKAAFSLIRR